VYRLAYVVAYISKNIVQKYVAIAIATKILGLAASEIKSGL